MTLTRRISADEAHALRKDHLRGDQLLKVASAPGSWNRANRSARFVMNAQAEDRHGDITVTAGIDTTNFLKNSAAFLSHDSGSWPIGTWANLTKHLRASPPRLEGDLVLGPAGGPIPAIDQAAWSIENGLMRGASIGFIPDWSAVERVVKNGSWTGGLQFNQVELIEASLVGIPASPESLAKNNNPRPATQTFDAWLQTPEGEKAARRRMRELTLAQLKRGALR